MRRAARVFGWVVLIANFLDLTTSIIASPVDLSYPPPARSAFEWAVQLALVLPLLYAAGRRAPALLGALRRASVPRVPLALASAFVLIEVVHVALRLEDFPFSPVAMYSNAVTVGPPARKERWTFVVVRPEGQDLLSPERESTLLGKYLSDFDYKMTAAVTMYMRSSVVFRLIQQQVMAAGFPAPVLVDVNYDVATGKVIAGPARAIHAEAAARR